MANERTCFHSRRRIQHTAYLFLSLESCSSHLLYPPNAAGELSIDIHGARSSPFNAKRKIRRNTRYLSPPLSLHKVIREANVDYSLRLYRSVGLALRSLFTLSSVCTHRGHVISPDQKYTLMRWRKFAPAASHFGRDFADQDQVPIRASSSLRGLLVTFNYEKRPIRIFLRSPSNRLLAV